MPTQLPDEPCSVGSTHCTLTVCMHMTDTTAHSCVLCGGSWLCAPSHMKAGKDPQVWAPHMAKNTKLLEDEAQRLTAVVRLTGTQKIFQLCNALRCGAESAGQASLFALLPRGGHLNEFYHILNQDDNIIKDFRGGPVDKNPPAQCRGHEFDPRSRKIPQAAEQLSPCTTTLEAPILDPMFPNKRSHCNEKPAHHT